MRTWCLLRSGWNARCSLRGWLPIEFKSRQLIIPARRRDLPLTAEGFGYADDGEERYGDEDDDDEDLDLEAEDGTMDEATRECTPPMQLAW